MAITAPRDIPCKVMKVETDGTRTDVYLHPMDIVNCIDIVEGLNQTVDPKKHDFVYECVVL